MFYYICGWQSEATLEQDSASVIIHFRLTEGGMIPDSKMHRANLGPILGRQDPGGPYIGPMKFAIWDHLIFLNTVLLFRERVDVPFDAYILST